MATEGPETYGNELRLRREMVRDNHPDAFAVIENLDSPLRSKQYHKYELGEDEDFRQFGAALESHHQTTTNQQRRLKRRADGTASAELISGDNIFAHNRAQEIVNDASRNMAVEGLASAVIIKNNTPANSRMKAGGRGGRGATGARAAAEGEIVETDPSASATINIKIGSMTDAIRVFAKYVLINGFARDFTNMQVMRECVGLSTRNDLDIDVADLERRLASDRPYKMLTSWNTGTFAVAVRLNNTAIFRCAPMANTTVRELAYVLWRAGDEQPTDRRSEKHTNNYLMTGLVEGSRYTTSRALAEPAIAAVIQVAITNEAELGFFRITVQKMLARCDIDKGYTRSSLMPPATRLLNLDREPAP